MSSLDSILWTLYVHMRDGEKDLKNQRPRPIGPYTKKDDIMDETEDIGPGSV